MSLADFNERRQRLGIKKTLPVSAYSRQQLAIITAEREQIAREVREALAALEREKNERSKLNEVVRRELDASTKARDIIETVAARHGVTVAEILGTRRTKPIVNARHAAIVQVCKLRSTLSLPQIGRIFHRDHTTIMHAVCKYVAESGEELRGWTPEDASVRQKRIRQNNRTAVMHYERIVVGRKADA